jgi:tetratricopeptide (TPR) repeat protein
MESPDTISTIGASAGQTPASPDDIVTNAEAEKEFSRGLKAMQEGNSIAALTFFEKAAGLVTTPVYSSYLGFCIAKERGQVQKGSQLCREAMGKEPENPLHYLNLGKIYLTMGNKQEAIRIFRDGLARGLNQEISGLLNEVGTRKQPVFSFLPRNHPINKYLGKLLCKLGLR